MKNFNILKKNLEWEISFNKIFLLFYSNTVFSLVLFLDLLGHLRKKKMLLFLKVMYILPTMHIAG